ncbi:MAG: hypothetical protein ACI85Z_001105 [Rheinheimera aquimaris]|jgi:hypothetical protein
MDLPADLYGCSQAHGRRRLLEYASTIDSISEEVYSYMNFDQLELSTNLPSFTSQNDKQCVWQ